MGLGDEAGQVREGFSPTCCWSMAIRWRMYGLLQQKERLVAILKGGEICRLDRDALARRAVQAAE